MTDTHISMTSFSWARWDLKNFLPSYLPISAFGVARVTGVSYSAQPKNQFLIQCFKILCVWDRVLLCRPCWPWIHNPLASASQVLGLQACTITPSFCVCLVLFKNFFKLLLYWGYILAFTKVLTTYHSWIHPRHHSPLSPSPIIFVLVSPIKWVILLMFMFATHTADTQYMFTRQIKHVWQKTVITW
jgi:hypothetical protein